MPGLKFEGFQGIIPKAAPTILAPTQAQRADNVRLYGGDLYPWKKPLQIERPDTDEPILSIYHVTHGATDERWLTFPCDTDVVEGPVPDIDEDRLFMTSDCTPPRKMNWDSLSTGDGPYPATTFPMGVPFPTVAPTLAATGTGTGTAVTRAYVYTWVNLFGSVEEESSPSPASQVNWQTGQAITVTRTEAPPPPPDYNVTKWRIYRTVTGSTAGVVNYLLVAEVPIGTTTFNDNISDAAIPGDPLASDGYDPPPENMRGLCIMPNGILCGFFDNTVCFSEPYKPHAWPASYQQTLGYQIVGMAVYEQNLVVMTRQCPYILTGITPLQMTVTRVSLWEPCVSKRSIASDMSGVCYASANGLIGISSLVQGVISNGLMRRVEWGKTNPNEYTSAIFNGQYFGFHTDTTGDSSSGGWAEVIDKSDDTQLAASTRVDVAAFSNAPPMTRLDYWANAVYVDKITAALYVVNKRDNAIYRIDGDELDAMNQRWHSKRFVLPAPMNFAAIQCDADYDLTDLPLAALVERYVTENTDWLESHTPDQIQGTVNSLQVNGGGIHAGIGNTMGTVNGSPHLWDVPSVFDFRNLNIQVYAADTLVFTYNPLNIEPVRMLSGFKARIWEVEITSNFRVRSVAMATSMQELRQL